MKVLIATPYYAPKLGGLERYAQIIAEHLATDGWEVHVLTSGQTRGMAKLNGVTVHTLSAWAVLANTPINPLWSLQARRLIQQLQPDVINVHAPVPSMALAVALATGKTPLVVTYHAGSMKKGHLLPDSLIWIYEQLFLPQLLQRATAIICASNFVRNDFLSSRKAKSTTITPGVDSQLFVPAPNKQVANRVLFIGDFRDPRKGLNYLIEAIRLTPQAKLRVVGQGSGQLAPGVEYLGVLTGADLIHEIQSANLLVLPSITKAESFGMVLLEAMACGVPVIGSDIGGIGQVIKDGINGTLVPPADSARLAASIQYLLTNPAYTSSLAAEGRTQAVRNYAWTDRGRATARILENAVKLEATHV